MGKQVKTPRFYVDMVTFLHATGETHWADTGTYDDGGAELLYMNCANPFTRTNENANLFRLGNAGSPTAPKTSFPVNFVALLNHNLGSADGYLHIGAFKGIGGVSDGSFFRLHADSQNHVQNWTNVINCGGGGSYNVGLDAEFNGTSIWTFDDGLGNPISDYWYNFYVKSFEDDNGGITAGIPESDLELNHQLGSFVVGKYWDAPNSPDLNLTMSRRFDGIKKQKTIGGKTLANIYYDGPTEWTMNGLNGTYKYPPFELDFAGTYNDDSIMQQLQFEQTAKSGLGRKGLRSWKLTFSYISEDNMWMAYENSSRAPFDYVETGTNATTGTEIPTDDGEEVSFVANPMLSDNSFNFVWNCTLGGTLPFIFQPDNTNNNPDQFAICNFRENTLSVQQVAFNTYKLSITIDEVA